jgi:hypothetical protein
MNDAITTRPTKRPVAITTTDLNDTDAIKTPAATSTSPQNFAIANFDGAQINGGGGNGSFKKLPRTVTVTSSAQVGAYTTVSPIVVTGIRGNQVVTDNLQLTQANGNETIRGTVAFDKITAIAIPAQAAGTGTLQFGVGDICGYSGEPACRAYRAAAGTIVRVRYGTTAAEQEDVPTVANALEHIEAQRIMATGTDGNLMLYP